MNRKILKRDRFDLAVKKYSNFFKISLLITQLPHSIIFLFYTIEIKVDKENECPFRNASLHIVTHSKAVSQMGTSLRNIWQHCIHRFRSRVSRIDRETVYRLHPRNGRYCIPSQRYYIPPPFLSKFPENFSTINFPWILSNQ